LYNFYVNYEIISQIVIGTILAISYAEAALDYLIYLQLNDVFHDESYPDNQDHDDTSSDPEYHTMRQLVLSALGFNTLKDISERMKTLDIDSWYSFPTALPHTGKIA